MYFDISKPPPPLPSPELRELGFGISLLQPLSRRGTGPGVVVIVPDSLVSNIAIEQGIPSPLIKWAEEGFMVVEIQEKAMGDEDVVTVLAKAALAISKEERCEPKGMVGLVVYGAKLWNLVAQELHSIPEIAAAAVYANTDEDASLTPSPLPCIRHLAGSHIPNSPCALEAPGLTVYHYPSVLSSLFALPFQPEFSYSAEALSHTRNLSFLKRLMDGPYFDLEKIWEEHTYFEFENRSVQHTMSTMVQEPYVNHIPTMTGGIGRERLTHFYTHHFIFNNPPDVENELISRTIGIDRVVDEFIYKMTHNCEVDWLYGTPCFKRIPGIPPTGRKVEIPMLAVVNFRGDRLYHEHISWDQGTVLSQLGLMPEYLPIHQHSPLDDTGTGKRKRYEIKVPVAGAETAGKMRDRNALESNGMFNYKIREVNDLL